MMLGALEYEFFQRALTAGLLASVACGIVGTFVVVRRIASISGGLAHAAFGGIGLGYLAGFPPMLGALVFGLLSALGVGVAELRLRQGLDTLIAMVWAVGMALGIIFASLAPGPTPDLLSYLLRPDSTCCCSSSWVFVTGSCRRWRSTRSSAGSLAFPWRVYSCCCSG